MKETILQNIDISSQIIVFDQQTHQGQLTLINKHQTLGTIFKIKATKLNIIDVKPAKGYIKPQAKVTINFKLSANLVSFILLFLGISTSLQFRYHSISIKQSPQQMQTTQNNDKFLIQVLNITNQQPSRQQIQNFWKAYKNNTANLQHGYGCYKVFMNLTGKKKLAVSNVKSQTINSQMYKSVGKSLAQNQPQLGISSQKGLNDDQLSKKYTQLKSKQQELIQQRQNIFKSSPGVSTKSKGKIKTYIILFIFLILGFMVGNYVRSSMVRVKHHQKIKQQKKSFFSFLPFFNE